MGYRFHCDGIASPYKRHSALQFGSRSGGDFNDYANEIGVSAHTLSDTAPSLVIGFVVGFVHGDDLRRLEVQLARHLQARQCSQPHADSDLQE
jgi:hypothetical protein